MSPLTATREIHPTILRAAIGDFNGSTFEAEVVFSTGAAVARVDASGRRYNECLSMKPQHVRLRRLNDGAPVLDAHSCYSVSTMLGAVVPNSARLEGGSGYATLRFSRRKAVAPIVDDIRDGLIRFVSVGYLVHRFEEEAGKEHQLPVRTAIDWEPYEISMVPMPADAGSKVRREELARHRPVIVPVRSDDEDDAEETLSADQDRVRCLRFARALENALDDLGGQPISRQPTVASRAAPKPQDLDWPDEPARERETLIANARLAQFPSVEPAREREALVQKLYDYARRQEWQLPERVHLIFKDAPGDVSRGLCLRRDEGEIFVYLRADLQGRELAHVAAHEFAHASDLHLGRWDRFEEWEREQRADLGAARLVVRFEDDGLAPW